MMDKKKIMFVLPRMNGGGAERVVSILANHLCSEYDVSLLVFVSNDSFYPLDSQVHFTSAMFDVNRKSRMTRLVSMAENFFQAVRFVRAQVEKIRPHIVFSLLEEADIVTSLALIGIRSIIHISSERNDPSRRGRMIQHILNRIYLHCDRFVCQTDAVSQYYSLIPNDRKWIIPNPVDFTTYPERVDEGEIVRIVSVGRLKPQKNFGLLIESFASIAPSYPKVLLDIYGEGSMRNELQNRIDNLGLEDRIILKGASQNVLLDIRDAAIFVMSSDYEGFPNALVEAIAMGIPVVSTDFATGVAHEIITEQVGLVVPCNDKDALANAMGTLLADSVLRSRIRKNGYKSIAQFECSHIIKVWDKFLKKTIADVSASRRTL